MVTYKNATYTVLDFTNDLKLVFKNADTTICVSANEIDIKKSIIL